MLHFFIYIIFQVRLAARLRQLEEEQHDQQEEEEGEQEVWARHGEHKWSDSRHLQGNHKHDQNMEEASTFTSGLDTNIRQLSPSQTTCQIRKSDLKG
jgi:hypothetical protein